MATDRMTSVEIQAYSVEEALRLALEQLDLREDQVDIEVLSDAGPDEDSEALVRVTAKGMASQPVPTPRSTEREGRRQPGPRRAPGDRPSSRGVPPPRIEPQLAPRRPSVVNPDRVESADETVVKEIVRDLLDRMGFQADIYATDNPSTVPLSNEDPPTIFIDVLGQDLGFLIGRRGDHLAQLQYMVNLLANKKIGEWTRVIVDIEGYRARREEALVGLAERVARQVSRTRRPIMLEPMPPNERRIVHLSLRANSEVTTESTGEGGTRRITVHPK
ncbi:MAG: RNA-binding cell elongation regulator Jag/EloR [Thermomicrobiales bacterium]